MKRFTVWAGVAIAVAGGGWVWAQPTHAAPQKEHEWLKQLVGEWTTEAEVVMAPGQAPVKISGTEVVRSLGGFWTVGELKAEFMGNPVTGILTVGYDPKKKKYVGTFVASTDGHLWKYEGTLDDSGKVLTLNTEGPATPGGKMVKMKDVIEIKDKDHRVLTSYMQDDSGKWVQFMSIKARRR